MLPIGTTSSHDAPHPETGHGAVRAARALRAARSVAIICHVNPDADTLGGALALADGLSRLDTEVHVVCDSAVPASMQVLPGVETIRSRVAGTPDTVVLVDCASIERVGSTTRRWLDDFAGTLLNVDHHRTNSGYGTVHCLDARAAATSEIVAEILVELGLEWNERSATLILAGVLHDTGGLRSADTSARTLRLVADLVDAGAPLAAVSSALFDRRSFAALRLWGAVARDVEQALGGQLVIGVVRTEMATAAGADMLDVEDLPEMLVSVEGARIALLLRETAEGTRVSARSDGRVDVSRIAAEFGGGGHERAAGCTLREPLETARRRLLDSCARHLEGPS